MISDGTKVNSAFLHELDIRFMKELVRFTKPALESGTLDE